MREINHLSLHPWLRSAIPDSQQPASPIGFLFLKLPPPPCAVLLVLFCIPVVPARGGAEVALGIYKSFLIYRTCMRRVAAKSVRACILRKWCPVSHVTFEAPLRTSHFSLHSSPSTLHTSHCTLPTPRFTLHTPHFTHHTSHFAVHTSHFSLLTSHCFLHTPDFTLHTSHCTLHAPRFTLHPSHSTLHLV